MSDKHLHMIRVRFLGEQQTNHDQFNLEIDKLNDVKSRKFIHF